MNKEHENIHHVLGISGSLRKSSYNTALLRAATAMLPEGMALELFDLSEIPLYNDDLCPMIPQQVRELRHAIASADALLLATPEYNHSVPGVLKNALDWASRPYRSSPFNGKPTAIVGAGGSLGTVRAQRHLREILESMKALTLAAPELLVRHPEDKFDAAGNLVDEPTRRQLRAVLEALGAAVVRLHPADHVSL